MISAIVQTGTAHGFEVDTGDTFRVVNVEGGQVGDLFALSQDDAQEHLGMPQTRTFHRQLGLRTGMVLFSNRYGEFLTVTADTSGGVHDSLLPACSPGRYVSLGGSADHANCEANFMAAVSAQMPPPPVHQPLNCFQDTRVDETGQLTAYASPAAPGTFIEFRAMQPLFVVVSACPMDISPINGGRPRNLGIERDEGAAQR